MRVSKRLPTPAADCPFRMNGCRLSKLPNALKMTLPPFAASGFVYSKCSKSAPYFGVPVHGDGVRAVHLARLLRQGDSRQREERHDKTPSESLHAFLLDSTIAQC